MNNNRFYVSFWDSPDFHKSTLPSNEIQVSESLSKADLIMLLKSLQHDGQLPTIINQGNNKFSREEILNE